MVNSFFRIKESGDKVSQIEVQDVSKTFKISKRAQGLKGSLKGLVKREYSTVKALDSISFSIEKGDVVGYIGPNGAGKSTTIKILSGILFPDEGTCTVDGRIPWRDRKEHVKDIGVVFGQRTQLWWDLPVIESFALLRDIYKIPEVEYRKEKEELSEMLGIANLLNTPVRQLSLGQKMKCELTAALLHKPKILFLDEPTIGLDATSKLIIRDHIKDINENRGVTVILTTHDLDDIEVLCQRLIVVNNGKIVEDGAISQILRHIQHERKLFVELADGEEKFNIPYVNVLKKDGQRFYLSYDTDKVIISDLLKEIVNKYPIKEIFIESPKIEEIIARIYESKKVI